MRDTASYTSTACMWNARIPFSLLILFVAASATARSVGAASCRPSTCALDAFALCDVSGELEGELSGEWACEWQLGAQQEVG